MPNFDYLELNLPELIEEYQPPTEETTIQEATELVAQYSQTDLEQSVTYCVKQIRWATALAEACKLEADFALAKAKGLLRMTEYRRTLIFGMLTAGRASGIQPGAVKGLSYTANLQATPGSLSISKEMELWKEPVENEIKFAAYFLLSQAIGKQISRGEALDQLSRVLDELAKANQQFNDFHSDPDFDSTICGTQFLDVKVAVSWDKKLITQLVKGVCVKGFELVKGTALRLALGKDKAK